MRCSGLTEDTNNDIDVFKYDSVLSRLEPYTKRFVDLEEKKNILIRSEKKLIKRLTISNREIKHTITFNFC